jgi:hypothetical protein
MTDMNTNITFVTAFIELYNREISVKSPEWRFQHFEKIAKYKIPIVLFITYDLYIEFKDKLDEWKHVHIVIIQFEKSKTYDVIMSLGDDFKLPTERCSWKDSKKFMILMNQKLECLYDAIQINPFQTEYFAWMDFNLNHVFKLEDTPNYLYNLNNKKFDKKFICIPGCWKKGHEIESIGTKVNWRFSGGFVFGDKESLLNLWNVQLELLPIFFQQYKNIVWEVNFWTWLEYYHNINFSWYYGNHDDSIILNLPIQNFL